MTCRHALLIGVPHYEDPEFDDERLRDAVKADVAAMRAALDLSGYEIVECGTGEAGGEVTPTRIRRAIRKACADVPADGTLIIYFSGHGVTIDGQDFLVPADAYRADIPSDVNSLVPVIPADSLTACQAKLVVFFTDACRVFPSQAQVPEPRIGEPGGQMPYLANGGHFVLVTGCGAGQVCHYDESGSAFTQSLTKALDARNPARTLKEVVDEVTGDMARRSRQRQGDAQDPVVRYPSVLELAGDVLVCDGDERAAAWRKAAEASPFLERCVDPDHVQAVVAECARRCGIAEDTLRNRTGLADPWTDQDYPVRVLRRSEFLLRENKSLTSPSADEAALLITAPFLREAVIAVGIHEAASVSPANLDRTYEASARGDLELTHEMHQHLVRRAAGLRERARAARGQPPDPGSPEAKSSDQLVMWLVHRWLCGRVQLWDEPGAQEIYGLGQELLRGCAGTVSESEARKLVAALLLAVGAEPADERLLGRLRATYISDRWRFIAVVLWLAGDMAADLRRLPPVVADLLGTGMELPFTDIQDAAGRRAEWVRQDTGEVDLRLVCEHPALHEVFESIVKRIATVKDVICDKNLLPIDVQCRLPLMFTMTGLRAATKQDDEPAYAVPLSRFQIAEEKVRELLMGKQLYGEPALAIRELYQNALDACRWREIRQEYRRQKHGDPPTWDSLIRFVQGNDDAGRPFIECEDNGVGMDEATLKHVFANAGERFVYGQEFRAEQADWAEYNLRLISNSQFGVGVFSYFMLADEITVTTRHQRRDGGVAADAYEVRIASSGSLIQIRKISGDLPNAGTKVRLYLGGDVTGVSVLRTLRDLLWVAEHRVEVTTPDGDEIWKPGELRRSQESTSPLKHGRDLWWVAGDGGITADGIKTGEEFFGLVVNLRDERRPQFTVDRNKLREWDKKWVREEVARSLPALKDWQGFTLAWLWRVAYDAPTIGQQIFDYALSIEHHVPVGEIWGKSEVVPLGAAGCLSSDSMLFTQERRYLGRWFAGWRVSVWTRLVSSPTNQDDVATASKIDGFPVPDSTDSAILDRLGCYYSDYPLSIGSVATALIRPERTVLSQLRRIRRYAITGLNISAARNILPIEYVIIDNDMERSERIILSVAATRSMIPDTTKAGSAGLVLWASYQLSLPVDEVLRRAQIMTAGNSSFHTTRSGELAHRPCTYDEARLLSRTFYPGTHDWIDGDIPPRHLVCASEEFGQSLAEILSFCDHELAPLGVRVAARESYPEDTSRIEFLALRYVRTPGQSLRPLDIVMIASQSGESVGEVYEGLSRLEVRGMLTRPPITGPLDFSPSRQELSSIQHNISIFSRRRGWQEDYVESYWIDILGIIMGSRSTEAEQRLARSLSEFVRPSSSEIDWFPLLAISFSEDRTILEVAEEIRKVYPDATPPRIDQEISGIKVSWEIFVAMAGQRRSRRKFGPGSILDSILRSRRILGDLLYELNKFRSLGAPVPPCNESLRLELNKISVDNRDLAMLTAFDKYGDSQYIQEIDSIQLIQIAGRYGWTLAEAHQRFARFIPIGLKLEYPHIDFPDEIVYWYDLLALTTNFDGQAPVITGSIDQAYLEKAAEEIFDAPPEQIPGKVALLRERLKIYAPLFDFELAAPEETSVAQ